MLRSVRGSGRPALLRAPLFYTPLLCVPFLCTSVLVGCTRVATVTPPAHGAVVLSGLNGPQGVYLDDQDRLWAIDSGTAGTTVIGSFPGPGGGAPTPVTLGTTARVLRVASSGGEASVVASLPSLGTPFGISGGSRLVALNGQVYATNGQWPLPPQPDGTVPARPTGVAAVVRLDAGGPAEVADLYTWEAGTNPDGVPAAEGGIDSHPYGVAALGGQLYVADAAANDLLRVDPASGAVKTVTVFAPLQITPAGGGAPVSSQAVPTGVTVGSDGALYVSLYPGGAGEEVAGSAQVVRVDPTSGAQSVYASGLNSLTDVRRGPDGNLYAVSFAPTGPGSGAVIRLKADNVKETVLGGLNFPTSLAFNSRGDAFISVGGVGAPGSGKVVRYDFLTGYQTQ